tara:strand:+ start:8210 stop:10273 length:2064 start_codon:yes stop_codon:yes gene_type:complete
MVKSILKSDLINYSENKEIDMEDIGYSTVIYEYDLYNRNIEIALGKIKHTYSKYNIVYYPIYLIIDDTPKSKIGIFEINSEKILNNFEDDQAVDLEQGEIIIFISNDMFNRIIGSQPSINNKNIEINKNNYDTSYDIDIDDIIPIENMKEMSKKDDIFRMDVQESKLGINIQNEDIFIEDKSKEIEPLLMEETLDVSKNDNNDFKVSVSNTWIEQFMKNNHYSITDNEGSGDCFFAVIRDAYKSIGKATTVEKLRLILVDEVNEEIFNEYKQLYLNFDAVYKEKEKEMKNIKKAISILKKRKDNIITKEDNEKLVTEVNELLNNYKLASLDKSQMKDILHEFEYMKTINNLDEFKEFIKTSNFWADTWAITTIEKKLNIKIIILSEESYNNQDFDSVMMCGQLNDKELEDKGNFEPDYYIITGYTGNHYQLINYKNKSILKFREVPYDIKTLIVSKCLEKNAGPYYIIKDFVEYKKKMGVNENNDKDENEYLKRDLYNKDVVFMFYDQSSPKAKPGKGSGEQIPGNLIIEYIELTKGKNKNWRRKLDDDWLAPFTIDDKRWLSVTHYVLGSQFKKGFPDFYHEFSLDSGSKIANDIDLVKIAGGKTGKTKDIELRKKEIVIDNDYYGYDKNSRYIQERTNALEAKFIQNADLKHILMNTKNAKLNKFKRRANPEADELLMKIRQSIR